VGQLFRERMAQESFQQLVESGFEGVKSSKNLVSMASIFSRLGSGSVKIWNLWKKCQKSLARYDPCSS